jgi:hypothetical protein
MHLIETHCASFQQLQQLHQLPFLGIQVEPVDLSVRPAAQLRPDPAAKVDRRLWILPLAKSESTDAEVTHTEHGIVHLHLAGLIKLQSE